MAGPATAPSATARARYTPRPPTSRTEVIPASSAARRSRVHRAARSASGSRGSRPRSKLLAPMRCPWHSHIPGMTATALVSDADGDGGARAAGPA